MGSGRKHRGALLEAAFHSIVFAGALLIARAWGPGQEGFFDSAFYLDGARHLAHGHGYVGSITEPDQTDFGPITRWAPGFSLLISLLIALGMPALDAAAAILGLCYASAATLVGALGFRVLGRRNWFACLVAVVAFGTLPATLRSLNALLSDLPFATFALSALLLCVQLSRARRPHALLQLGLGACFGCMFLLRYSGALFIPGLLLATLWTMRARSRSFWLACRYLLPSVAIFVVVVAVWIVRNKALGPEAFGQRLFLASSIVGQLRGAAYGAFNWFTQLTDDEYFGASLLPKISAACGLLLLPFAWRPAKRSLVLLVLPALAYFAAMATAASQIDFDSIDHPRFWIAVWPLAFLTIALVALRIRKRLLLPLRLGAACSLAAVAVVFSVAAYASLGDTQTLRGLLARRWAVAAAMLPPPELCRLFVMDPRPFMLHRELGPSSGLPLSIAEYEAAAPHHPSLCLVVVNQRLRLSSSAEQRRPLQLAVVDALLQAGRLTHLSEGAGVTIYRAQDTRPPLAR